MKYGEKFETTYTVGKDSFKWEELYKYTEWHDYHTNDIGEGLWHGTRQIEGTCQFDVRGCKTEKAAKAKIRNYVKRFYDE